MFIWVLFFPWQTEVKAYLFLIFSKKLVLVSLIFFYLVSLLPLIYFIPSFCWLWALCVLLFLITLGRLGCLFEIFFFFFFFVSWGTYITIKLPIRIASTGPQILEKCFIFHLFWGILWFLFDFFIDPLGFYFCGILFSVSVFGFFPVFFK